MSDGTKQGDSRRVRTMRFRVSEQEACEIDARAKAVGFSLSAYLRAAALNHKIRSVYDLMAVADLGRVAGLLKRWLAEKRGQGAPPVEVEAMMQDFWALQTELSAIMRRALK